MKKRLLILEDGSVYEGCGFGADHYQVGELVFNTGRSGYQEVLSDLSYCGQIVMMNFLYHREIPPFIVCMSVWAEPG